MIIDKLMSPAIGKALSDLTTGGMTTIGSVLDLGANRNQGLLAEPYGPGWVIGLRGATSGSASTLSLQLITSAAANLGTPTVLWSVTGLTLASMAGAKGLQLFVPVPSTNDWLRYAAFQGQAGTAVFTGGEVEIQYAGNIRNWRAYPAETGR